MGKEVFISYSRKNIKFVMGIKDYIDNAVGIKCWLDIDEIEPGCQFEKKIVSAINNYNTFLFMMSAQSMEAEVALDELDLAKRHNKRIVLVQIDDSEMTDLFYFKYNKYDRIKWADPIQRDRLIRNLKSWFNKDTTDDSLSARKVSAQEMCDKAFYLFRDVRDYKAAFKCFLDAAGMGSVNAQYQVGKMYELGWGTNPDNEEAANWYLKAAEKGNADAQYSIGQMYLNGKGVLKGIGTAIMWFRKAAEQGHEKSISELKRLSDYWKMPL